MIPMAIIENHWHVLIHFGWRAIPIPNSHGSCFSFWDLSQRNESSISKKTHTNRKRVGTFQLNTVQMECSYYEITEIVSVRFFALLHSSSTYSSLHSRQYNQSHSICVFAHSLTNKTTHFFLSSSIVPSDPPSHMEALLLNSSAVYLKWKAPALQAHNGKLFVPS